MSRFQSSRSLFNALPLDLNGDAAGPLADGRGVRNCSARDEPLTREPSPAADFHAQACGSDRQNRADIAFCFDVASGKSRAAGTNSPVRVHRAWV